jgi:hypothetical protein
LTPVATTYLSAIMEVKCVQSVWSVFRLHLFKANECAEQNHNYATGRNFDTSEEFITVWRYQNLSHEK